MDVNAKNANVNSNPSIQPIHSLHDISNVDLNTNSLDTIENHCVVIDDSEGLLSVQSKYVNIDSANDNNSDASDPRYKNYVYHLLMETGEGEFQIRAYDFEQIPENYENLIKTKRRTYFSLQTIAKLVIFHEVRRFSSYEILEDRLDTLATIATGVFPTILKESFYSKASGDSGAHGAFHSFYISLKEKAIALNLLTKRGSRKKKCLEEDQIFSNSLQELQKSVLIIDQQYLTKWASTAIEEKIQFFQCNDIKTILTRFPNYLNPSGYNLIQADFCKFFNKPNNLFCDNWPGIAVKLLKLAVSKKSRDPNIKSIVIEYASLLQNLDSVIENSSLMTENQKILALILLPYLFKKITKQTAKSKTKKTWIPEKTEVLNTFIVHVKETNNFSVSLQTAKEHVQKVHIEHKLQVKPYIIINGPSLDHILFSCILIEDHIYQVPLTTTAVDICFQVYKVFHEKFPLVSNHIWQFLEREVYSFEVPNAYQAVTELRQQLTRF